LFGLVTKDVSFQSIKNILIGFIIYFVLLAIIILIIVPIYDIMKQIMKQIILFFMRNKIKKAK